MTDIARLLALPRAARIGAIELADKVASGLPVSAADAMRDLLRPLGPGAIHEIVPEATLRRARKEGKPLSRDASERLYDMARVFVRAEQVMGERAKAVRFMQRPNVTLRMRTPFELARSSTAGAEAVIELLGQAEAGVAV